MPANAVDLWNLKMQLWLITYLLCWCNEPLLICGFNSQSEGLTSSDWSYFLFSISLPLILVDHKCQAWEKLIWCSIGIAAYIICSNFQQISILSLIIQSSIIISRSDFLIITTNWLWFTFCQNGVPPKKPVFMEQISTCMAGQRCPIPET